MQSTQEFNTQEIINRANLACEKAEKLSDGSSEIEEKIAAARSKLNEIGVPTKGPNGSSILSIAIFEFKQLILGAIGGNAERAALEVCKELEAISRMMAEQNQSVKEMAVITKEMGGYVKQMSQDIKELKEQGVESKKTIAEMRHSNKEMKQMMQEMRNLMLQQNQNQGRGI
jgi:hypothetical protein